MRSAGGALEKHGGEGMGGAEGAEGLGGLGGISGQSVERRGKDRRVFYQYCHC